MKPYGIPRHPDIDSPDLADIHLYGLKSSISRIPGKNGDIKNSFRASKNKRNTRRIWKKKARIASKNMCKIHKMCKNIED